MTQTSQNNQVTRYYKQEDIQQILQIAISRQANDGEFSREQLWEIADELDIDPQTLELAESEWLARQGEQRKRQEFNLYRRSKFKRHFGRYAITNSFLMLFNFVAVGHLTWSLYLLLLWGLGLGLNAWNTFQSDGEEYEMAFQQWYRRHQFKETVNGFFQKLIKAVN